LWIGSSAAPHHTADHSAIQPMATIEKLREYRQEMLRCNRCGYCHAACPVYDVLRREPATARGRIQLLRAVSEGVLPISALVSRYIYGCTDCQACRVSCPGGVRTDEIFAAAREVIANSEFLPATLAELEQRVRTTHNISGEPGENRLLWAENLEDKPEDLVGKERAEVLLFTGCVSALYPMAYGILQDLVEILQVAEVDFTTLGPDEWCCGYPLLSAGMPVEDLIAHNLDRLQALGAKTLVTTCPSCYHMWRHHYALESVEVMHATEFLAQLVEAGRVPLRPLNMRVTYHDPCDLGRKSEVYDAPRRIIAAIPGLEFVEMEDHGENAMCCGGGGNLETLDAELSSAVARLRLEQAQAAGAQAVISACQQCERTLTMAARREKKRIKVMDVVQLLRAALLEEDTEV
jgi:heterodisulfide reductase subunit D